MDDNNQNSPLSMASGLRNSFDEDVYLEHNPIIKDPQSMDIECIIQ